MIKKLKELFKKKICLTYYTILTCILFLGFIFGLLSHFACVPFNYNKFVGANGYLANFSLNNRECDITEKHIICYINSKKENYNTPIVNYSAVGIVAYYGKLIKRNEPMEVHNNMLISVISTGEVLNYNLILKHNIVNNFNKNMFVKNNKIYIERLPSKTISTYINDVKYCYQKIDYEYSLAGLSTDLIIFSCNNYTSYENLNISLEKNKIINIVAKVNNELLYYNRLVVLDDYIVADSCIELDDINNKTIIGNGNNLVINSSSVNNAVIYNVNLNSNIDVLSFSVIGGSRIYNKLANLVNSSVIESNIINACEDDYILADTINDDIGLSYIYNNQLIGNRELVNMQITSSSYINNDINSNSDNCIYNYCIDKPILINNNCNKGDFCYVE